MPFSLYDISVPVFVRGLEQLQHLLDKGLAHATEQGTDPTLLAQARLAPDMFPLTGQVQSASDAAKLGAARLSGVAAPAFADTETTYPELQARVAKTFDYLKTVDRASIDGQEAREVVIKTRRGEMQFTADRYLLQFALPNFFFHLTTAYGVLRHSGVPIGKLDYLGPY